MRPEVEAVIQDGKLDALRHRVRVLCPNADPARVRTCEEALKLIESRGTDHLGFLQFFHLHRASAAVAAAARGPRLAGVAAQLLGARRVRLLQDAVFYKEPGFDATNWHSDLRMAPLDTNSYVTAWLPLRPVAGDERDSGLAFAAGSHRDFALPFWHDVRALGDLERRGYRVQGTGPMALGDVSWHHGWTLHCAGEQPRGTAPRLAVAVSYFADGARLLDLKGDPSLRREMLHDEDAEGHGAWLKDLKGGAPARHPLLPVVWDGGRAPAV
ncbi:MAG: hypothetical protein J3K34DRAFT_169991 [Monoraphidium minutum]|nr:MAG: hypothetical protein J3K34DRAFT_169991 [Monoraphidium minutum]